MRIPVLHLAEYARGLRIGRPVDPVTTGLHTLGYVNRLYDFLRRHPTWVDSLLGWLLLLVSSLIVTASPRPTRPGCPRSQEQIAAVPIALTMCVVVALRRRAPEKMLPLATGAGLAQVITDIEPFPGNWPS